MSRLSPLDGWSFLENAREAAPRLLGCTLIRKLDRKVRRARIVETEAYLPDDPASHSFSGRTPRNGSMFSKPGTAYVYRIHRVVCLNVVTGPEGRGEAVLIRAVEPLDGLEEMIRARTENSVGRAAPSSFAITNGPGKLCQALDVTLAMDGTDLLAPSRPRDRSRLSLEPRDPDEMDLTIVTTPRIGISKAKDEPLRFTIEGNRWISKR